MHMKNKYTLHLQCCLEGWFPSGLSSILLKPIRITDEKSPRWSARFQVSNWKLWLMILLLKVCAFLVSHEFISLPAFHKGFARHVLDRWAGSVLHFTRTLEKCSLCACLRELIFFMGAFRSVFQKDSKRSVYDGVGSIPWVKLLSLFLLFQHPENTVKVPDFRFRIFALLLSEVYWAGVFSLSPQKARPAGSSHGSCELVLRFWHFHLAEYPVYPPAASLCDSQIHQSRIWLSCEPSNIWTSDWWQPNLCSSELLANGETQGCSFPNRILQWPG